MQSSKKANPIPANDNVKRRGRSSWPLQELFNRGELGVNELQNRARWHAAQRFKREHDAASGDRIEESASGDWRELMLMMLETDEEVAIQHLGPNDGPAVLNDDNELQDNGTSRLPGVVDNAGFNPHRDLPAAAHEIYDRQVIALAADVLGYSYPVLAAMVLRSWNLQQVGETEGARDPASARGVGKGMMRMALSDLVDFYTKLDRLDESGVPTTLIWPLVGTPAWQFAEMPDIRWKRGTTSGVVEYPGNESVSVVSDAMGYRVDAA